MTGSDCDETCGDTTPISRRYAIGTEKFATATNVKLSRIRDNSEAVFKTLKYGPEFPERFGSLREAREFMMQFTEWYNHEHRHTGIGLHTAADVHFGLASAKAAERRQVLEAARARHPYRFGTTTAPKILDLPDTVWINRPADDSAEAETSAA